ncbi:MrcB family domain-containing protein [Streptomyces sp. NPDC047928]|uniref:MrcB family domain-containing protein n=1 Tax=unclassified Streptomyces TaxID=2593676 RepID=UPI0037127886
MPLRDLLIRIAEIYEPEGTASSDRPGHALLWEVKDRTDLPWPSRCFATGNGGKGHATLTPWIGVFDRTINSNPHEGLYLAYIFNSDRSAVTLTLQQGVTRLTKVYGKGASLHRYLVAQSETLRRALRPALSAEWRDPLHLLVASKDWRPRAYEKANVAARRYEIRRLPSDEVLASDLREAVQLLRDAAVVERLWLQSAKVDEPILEYEPLEHAGDDPFSGFRAKSSNAYYVDVKGGRQRREREHEALVRRFAHHAAACGYLPLTEGQHPRDTVLRHREQPTEEWLVEAKTVSRGKEYLAVREAVGQLYEYRHTCYRKHGKRDPYLVALFSQDIGPFVEYLETLNIASIWESPDGWAGSPLVTEANWGLVT